MSLESPRDDEPATGVAPAASLGVHDVELNADRLRGRTFLLGNGGGFVLYLPATQNLRDRTLHPTKWFGASGFGRAYLEDHVIWLERGAERTKLDRSNQIGFEQYVDRAVRTFEIDGLRIRQTYVLPNGFQALAMTLETSGRASLAIQPEYDMRYYQAFNTSFDSYRAEIHEAEGQPILAVANSIAGPSPVLPHMDFYALCAFLGGRGEIVLLPTEQRLRPKIYRKDEARMMAIERVYSETQEHSPDEAPIWDRYETTAYAPAELRGATPLMLVHAFGDDREETRSTLATITARLPSMRSRKRQVTLRRLRRGSLMTGHDEIDTAYAQMLTRFSNCLVARDVKFHGDSQEHDHFNAIFAGNKYFLDAWKRDENISLIGLLTTGDFETVRAILNDTWQYQDQRTGRLPHIIRLGEPLVYYSSDGTLWALERLHRYTRMSGDETLMDHKYPMVEYFFEASLPFVRRGLLPSGGIIDPAYLWETWMDTPYTPRNGYPVEIELLWLTSLRAYLPRIRTRNRALADRLQAALQEGMDTFNLFMLDGYLADSLDYGWKPQELLTPNGYIAFGLDFPLPVDLQRSMIALGREQLAGRVGIRSLAPRDWPKVFSQEFMDDPKNFVGTDMASVGIYNYHRGIEWLWLNQFFVAAELRAGDTSTAYDTYLAGQVHAALHESGVAGLSELYDVHGALGADFQAWSMSGFIASLHQFLGVEVNAPERWVSVRPSIPARWSGQSGRYRVGSALFDVRYERSDEDQRIEVEPVGGAPDDYTLRLGIRLPPDANPRAVFLHGHPVAKGDLQEVREEGGRCEVWVETPFRGKTTATFRTGSDQPET